jgi:hypothetical protein
MEVEADMKASTDPSARTAEPSYTQINMSHIPVDRGVKGLLFSAGTVYIFLVGIPAVRWFFIGALAVGFGIALALRSLHRHKPASSFTPITR